MGTRGGEAGRGRASIVFALAMVVTSTGPWAAAAQDRLQPGGEPRYAALSLDSGFSDDPRTFAVTAGGSIPVGDLGIGCAGSVSARPHVRLTYQAGTVFPLNLYAISDDDVTLVVNRPDGSWVCNDDYDGRNPAVLIESPQAGKYEIWVGTYGGGEAAATLYISELEPDFGSDDVSDLDIDGTPAYATLSLSAAFADDPRTVRLRAGGSIEVSGLGDACTGSVEAAPQVRLNYTAGVILPLNIYASSEEGDLTLIVNRPDGTWICSDDFEGTDPAVLMDSPQSGRYDIWVGEYFGETVNATLFISELDPEF